MEIELMELPSIIVNARHNTSSNADEIVVNSESVITALGFPIEQELWCRVESHTTREFEVRVFTEEETFVPRGCAVRYFYDGTDMLPVLKLNRRDRNPRRFEIARKKNLPNLQMRPEMDLQAVGVNSETSTRIKFTIMPEPVVQAPPLSERVADDILELEVTLSCAKSRSEKGDRLTVKVTRSDLLFEHLGVPVWLENGERNKISVHMWFDQDDSTLRTGPCPNESRKIGKVVGVKADDWFISEYFTEIGLTYKHAKAKEVHEAAIMLFSADDWLIEIQLDKSLNFNPAFEPADV